MAISNWQLAKMRNRAYHGFTRMNTDPERPFCRENGEQLAISNWQLADPSTQHSAFSIQQDPKARAYHRFALKSTDPEEQRNAAGDFANCQLPIVVDPGVPWANCSLTNYQISTTNYRHRATDADRVNGNPAIHFEDLDAENDDQFLRTEKRVAVRRSPLPKKTANRVKKTVIIASTCAVLGLAAWVTYKYGVQSWRFRLESSDNIEISGVQNASRAEVMDAFGGDISRNIFSVVLEERKRKLEEIPWVESATVMRLLPNRLAVTIRERTPVAFVHMGSKVSLIDANGVVMGLPANKQARYSFPVIQGITDTEPLSSRAAVMKIYNRVIRELDSDEGAARHSSELSEVDLSDPEDVKVTANDPAGTLAIHLGNTDFLARYKLYLAHIAEWRQSYPNIQSVDLRYEGQVVVNGKR